MRFLSLPHLGACPLLCLGLVMAPLWVRAATVGEGTHLASTHAKGKHAGAQNDRSRPSADAEEDGAKGKDAAPKAETAYSFGLPDAAGKNLPLSDFKGKVLLIVNLGRDSSYASQLAGLEKLQEAFKDKGLVVLGIPSNDFGNAEPGTPAEVAKFYADAKVSFPVMQLSTLTGVHELPLFTYLANSKDVPEDGLHWNYTKFLVDRHGKVVARFAPEIAPDALQLQATVQEVVDGTWKPKRPAHAEGETAGDEDDDDLF